MVRPVTRLPSDLAREQLRRSIRAVKLLKDVLSESDMELLNDAMHCFADHPDWWGADEEFDKAMIFALCFDMEGFNSIKPEYNRLIDWECP